MLVHDPDCSRGDCLGTLAGRPEEKGGSQLEQRAVDGRGKRNKEGLRSRTWKTSKGPDRVFTPKERLQETKPR